eukprot:gene13362-17922_t
MDNKTGLGSTLIESYKAKQLNKPNVILYVINHNSESHDFAQKIVTHYPWAYHFKAQQSKFFESIIYQDLLNSSYYDQWKDADYVGLLQYRMVSVFEKDAISKKLSLQMHIHQDDIRELAIKSYLRGFDVFPFFVCHKN